MIVRSLLPAGVAVAEGPILTRLPGLHPSEFACVQNAAPVRIREFSAGRSMARSALAQIGIGCDALLANADRTPRWPPGTIGSISHSGDYCAAAAARVGRWRGIGIDVQEISPVIEELWPVFCRSAELNWLAAASPECQPVRAALIFSAKESVFKAQYPTCGHWMDFQDVEVSFGPTEFHVSIYRDLPDVAALAERANGRFGQRGRYCATALLL